MASCAALGVFAWMGIGINALMFITPVLILGVGRFGTKSSEIFLKICFA